MAEKTFRLAVPELGLSIEQNTEHVPQDGKFYVLQAEKIVAGYPALKKAREKLQQIKEELGFNPAGSPDDQSGEDRANREHVERLLDAATSYWSQSHKHRGGGARRQGRGLTTQQQEVGSMAEFKKVAQLSDLGPGKIKSTQINSDFVAVTQIDGKLYAFDDTCPHAACSLAEGELDGEVIVCVCHGREYNVTTGKPVNPPFGDPMKMYPSKVDGDDVLVEL